MTFIRRETLLAARKNRARSTKSRWPYRAIGIFVIFLVAVYLLVFLTGNKKPEPKLGIDLQGGTRVTLVPQGSQPSNDQLEQARKILENRVNGMGVSGATVQTDGNTLVITVPGDDSAQARNLGQTSQLLFRPVLNQQAAAQEVDRGKLAQTVADMANRWVKADVISPDNAQKALDELKKQLEQYNSSGQAQGQEAFAIPESMKITAKPEAKPANSIEENKQREQTSAMLLKDRQSEDPTTLQAAGSLLECKGSDPLAGQDDPAKPLVTCDQDKSVHLLDAAPVLVGQEGKKDPQRLTGEEIDTNSPITGGYDSNSGQMAITFKFKTSNKDKGGDTWAEVTQKYQGQQVAITLDSEVISAPTIQSPTPAGSTTQITGKFSEAEAKDLANNLKYGALPISFAGENGEKGGTATTIPATLGFASLKAGLIAGGIGLILVALYALAYYRGLGVITIFSLLLSALLIYGSLVLLGRWVGYSLDLAGIAGLIIGIGTTADSFVVYFERIKDEIRDGRTFRSAVPKAWERARRTILSGNLVSLIAAVVLYILAVGDVKGFAFTLGLTTVFDLFVVFLVSAPLIILASRKPFFSKPSVNGLGAVMRVAERRRAAGIKLPYDVERAENAKEDQPVRRHIKLADSLSETDESSSGGSSRVDTSKEEK